ncbi:Aste57867_14082 [Aphanomyces stellatus]|uniref:glucan endo-1,3-beta-D-glucosidase n=1 Tax=Aphanomyces stellatus TaxID=120398 RepID=A0A485KZV6_9STRA|nr:hypothetical protein As57867_014031 [Aphanomyces stellatus]VFT90910.1 Aste57867_14082 [Aphanomyces stellatus]
MSRSTFSGILAIHSQHVILQLALPDTQPHSMKLHFLFTTLVAATAFASTANECNSVQADVDYFGNDIGHTSRANAGDCCSDCQANPECVVSVWVQGTCWLKNKIAPKTTLQGATAYFPTRAAGDAGNATAPAGGSSSLPTLNVQSGFAYATSQRSGSYNMVTALQGCQKTSVSSQGPIAPYHEDVSFVFRGPMDIYNIAIFQPQNGQWVRASSYSQQSSSNLVFMNNANPQKFNGLAPQGYASADGRSFSQSASQFKGRLDDGSDPGNIYGGPGIATGVEVNILQPAKCTRDTCKGYFDSTFGLQGWSGSKIFVTKVKMDAGGIPAIWMLNAQVVRANQYGCNCRGMADPGGCGELDIAEAIYKGTNTLATHNYWLNANPSTGHDTWATRPTNGPATFVTILDETSGAIKVLKLSGDDFAHFDVDNISVESMNKLIQHQV